MGRKAVIYMVWLFLLLLSFLQVSLIWSVVLLKIGIQVKPLFGSLFSPSSGLRVHSLCIFGRKTQGPLFRQKHIPDNRLSRMVRQQQTDINYGDILPQPSIESEEKLASLLLHSGFAPLTVHNQVEILLNGGEKFQALFNALEGAIHHIHLSYYIFKDDEIGADVLKSYPAKWLKEWKFVSCLMEWAAISISGSFMRNMRQAGIQAEWFFPIRFPYITPKLNMRYHRKIVVVDGL